MVFKLFLNVLKNIFALATDFFSLTEDTQKGHARVKTARLQFSP